MLGKQPIGQGALKAASGTNTRSLSVTRLITSEVLFRVREQLTKNRPLIPIVRLRRGRGEPPIDEFAAAAFPAAGSEERFAGPRPAVIVRPEFEDRRRGFQRTPAKLD
jgi:hypothetical protein